MREARMDISIPRGAKGEVQGVILGHDFTAEHEWGIAKILDVFGVPDGSRAVGVRKRQATRVPSGLMWVKMDKRAGILLSTPFTLAYEKTNTALFYWNDLHLSTHKPGLAAAWDEDSFFVTSDDKEDIKALRDVYDACGRQDIAVALLAPKVYLGNNLSLIIVSRMSEETKDLWKSHDREKNRLCNYKKKSGIEKLLTKHGKKWFALSPSRSMDGSVRFWLNPFDQEASAGWYTLQDLRDWARNRGKVLDNRKNPL